MIDNISIIHDLCQWCIVASLYIYIFILWYGKHPEWIGLLRSPDRPASQDDFWAHIVSSLVSVNHFRSSAWSFGALEITYSPVQGKRSWNRVQFAMGIGEMNRPYYSLRSMEHESCIRPYSWHELEMSWCSLYHKAMACIAEQRILQWTWLRFWAVFVLRHI